MTQEDKDLLLIDLCARLPYGVKGIVEDGIKVTTPSEWPVEKSIEFSMRYMVIKNGWRPYLFPMSSMTEEQHTDMFNYYHNAEIEEVYASGDYLKAAYIGDDKKYEWLNRNHFDYRGLIEKGLAIDATGLNIY